MKRLGYLVNPWAGIGGRVALKGSDGSAIVERALELGAKRLSPKRATEALEKLVPFIDAIELITCPGEMGECEAKDCGFSPTIIGEDLQRRTTADDTRRAAKEMLRLGVDLILFAGGDGTARDIYDAIGTGIPIVGIPTGVKMHSAVFSVSPAAAGDLAALYLMGKIIRTAELEVMDIDEDAFRTGVLQAELHGFLKVPDAPQFTQGAKGGATALDDNFYMRGIARRVVQEMEQGTLYIIGSGTTCRAVTECLELPKTLLGVDVVLDKKLVASDVTEKQLLDHINSNPKNAIIIVTPIGGQGYIFGRGNQQLSAEVIRMVGPDKVKIIATPAKIHSVPNQRLRVDTGDPEIDQALRGPRRILTGAYDIALLEIV